jgi:uncharacterized membrane protein required for colicin V production
MTGFDIGILIWILAYGCIGIRFGLLRQLVLLALMVVLYFVSYFLSPFVAEHLGRFIPLEEHQLFPVIFLVLISISSSFIGALFSLLSQIMQPSVISRSIGAALGLFLGVLTGGLVLWLLTIFAPDELESAIVEGVITGPVMSVLTQTYVILEHFIRSNDITPFTIMNYKI